VILYELYLIHSEVLLPGVADEEKGRSSSLLMGSGVVAEGLVRKKKTSYQRGGRSGHFRFRAPRRSGWVDRRSVGGGEAGKALSGGWAGVVASSAEFLLLCAGADEQRGRGG